MSRNYPSSPREFSDRIEPKRMDLTLNPEDGSLQVAPLSQVLLAGTDSLYNDLLNVVQGELDVAVASSLPQPDEEDAPEGADANTSNNPNVTVTTKSERMSNLSFAQRRHELSWRLVSNGRSIQHIAALTAAAASTELSRAVMVSTRALQHTRTAWVQADEAQDALYFFHAQLFPGRAAPHDIYGAADLLLHRTWYDLPRDLLLATNRYETSEESLWSKKETDQRWQLSVREKLLLGEIGDAQGRGEKLLWSMSLAGGILTLTHGTPKQSHSGKDVYPIEALVTVLPSKESETNQWTLMSLSVNVQAKTGEFNHQLEASNRQRFDLHRLAALAMSREEAQNDEIAKPLERLFRVANTFLLSWQLEVLSAQAQALRRGVWAAAEGTPIAVTPVQFLPNGNGSMIISFWKVDSVYGPPAIKCLYGSQGEPWRELLAKHEASAPQQLRLAICTDTSTGISLYLSGSTSDLLVNSIVKDLVNAVSDPLALSASDALLAATKLCAELKCQALVSALIPHLPPWIQLIVGKGVIDVAAVTQYHGIPKRDTFATLFQIRCDLRTGSFVNTFPRSMVLLRRLAGNEARASEPMAVRLNSLPENRRRAAGSHSTGRAVREVFDSLIRSLNQLGQRTGVGSEWDNNSDEAASLRARSIQLSCVDVKAALIRCCGVTALYGTVAVAIGTSVGLSAIPDIAGGPVVELKHPNHSFISAPPMAIIVDQEIVQDQKVTSDGIPTKSSHVDQLLVGFTCSSSDDGICIYPLDIEMRLPSPSAFPERKTVALASFVEPSMDFGLVSRPAKRAKVAGSEDGSYVVDFSMEVSAVASFMVGILDDVEDSNVAIVNT